MNESSIKEFESLKKEIDDLKVKQLSDEREKTRLEEELEDQKRKIKDLYGVEVEDFERAIKDLQEEFDKKRKALLEKLSECKRKLGLEQEKDKE